MSFAIVVAFSDHRVIRLESTLAGPPIYVNLEPRSQKIEKRGQKSEVRGQMSENKS
jgi:hypothetical protein